MRRLAVVLVVAAAALVPSAVAAAPGAKPRPCTPAKAKTCPAKKPKPKPKPVAPTPSPPAPPAPPSPPTAPVPLLPSFHFSDGVSVADRALVRDLTVAALDAFERLGGERPDNVLFHNVVVGDGVDALAAVAARSTRMTEHEARRTIRDFTAVARGDGFLLNTGSRGWQASSDAERRRIVAHEMFHVCTWALKSTDMPSWLVEGTAEAFGYAVASAGGADLSGWRRLQHERTRLRMDLSLQSLEGYLGMLAAEGDAYSISYSAAELLTRGRGPGALVTLWREVRGGAPWPAAFERAFGRTVDAFYSEFEAYRRTL